MLASLLDALSKNDQAVREAYGQGMGVGFTVGIAVAVLAVAIVATRRK